jgi:putative transposase
VLKATWQRCRVHFMRNALAHAGKTQRRMVSAAIATVFVQETAQAAKAQWRSVADQLRGKFPKLGTLMDEAENDVLAFMTFPRAHWPQIYSTNPLERLLIAFGRSQLLEELSVKNSTRGDPFLVPGARI